MKRMVNFKWSLVVITLHLIAVLYFVNALEPNTQIPSHWNYAGEVDGYLSVTGMVLFGVGFGIGIFLLLFLMPYYSPWYRRFEQRFERLMPSLSFILVLFFALINVYSFYLAKFPQFQPRMNVILVLVGLLLVFLGNLLPKVPRNFFIGIRTPWTLSNDEVWYQTHRIGGVFFVIGGLILALKGIILQSHQSFQLITTVAAILAVLYPAVHSFIIYKKLKAQ